MIQELEFGKTCFGTKEFHKNSGICKQCRDYKECKQKNELKLKTKMKGGK